MIWEFLTLQMNLCVLCPVDVALALCRQSVIAHRYSYNSRL